MIASVDPLASTAGLRVLRDRGNARDAAITAGAASSRVRLAGGECPGIVGAWQVAAERFGTRPLGSLLEDAIAYAGQGFPLTERQARNNAEMAGIAAEFPDTTAVFFPNGRPPAAGSRLRQLDFARTLRRPSSRLAIGPPAALLRSSASRTGCSPGRRPATRNEQRHRLLMPPLEKCLSLRRADAINRR